MNNRSRILLRVAIRNLRSRPLRTTAVAILVASACGYAGFTSAFPAGNQASAEVVEGALVRSANTALGWSSIPLVSLVFNRFTSGSSPVIPAGPGAEAAVRSALALPESAHVSVIEYATAWMTVDGNTPLSAKTTVVDASSNQIKANTWVESGRRPTQRGEVAVLRSGGEDGPSRYRVGDRIDFLWPLADARVVGIVVCPLCLYPSNFGGEYSAERTFLLDESALVGISRADLPSGASQQTFALIKAPNGWSPPAGIAVQQAQDESRIPHGTYSMSVLRNDMTDQGSTGALGGFGWLLIAWAALVGGSAVATADRRLRRDTAQALIAGASDRQIDRFLATEASYVVGAAALIGSLCGSCSGWLLGRSEVIAIFRPPIGAVLSTLWFTLWVTLISFVAARFAARITVGGLTVEPVAQLLGRGTPTMRRQPISWRSAIAAVRRITGGAPGVVLAVIIILPLCLAIALRLITSGPSGIANAFMRLGVATIGIAATVLALTLGYFVLSSLRRLVERLAGRSVSARVASRQLGWNPQRTSGTLTLLTISLAVFMGTQTDLRTVAPMPERSSSTFEGFLDVQAVGRVIDDKYSDAPAASTSTLLAAGGIGSVRMTGASLCLTNGEEVGLDSSIDTDGATDSQLCIPYAMTIVDDTTMNRLPEPMIQALRSGEAVPWYPLLDTLKAAPEGMTVQVPDRKPLPTSRIGNWGDLVAAAPKWRQNPVLKTMGSTVFVREADIEGFGLAEPIGRAGFVVGTDRALRNRVEQRLTHAHIAVPTDNAAAAANTASNTVSIPVGGLILLMLTLGVTLGFAVQIGRLESADEFRVVATQGASRRQLGAIAAWQVGILVIPAVLMSAALVAGRLLATRLLTRATADVSWNLSVNWLGIGLIAVVTPAAVALVFGCIAGVGRTSGPNRTANPSYAATA